jgi:DNA-binding NarL/FixJ family response regulator
MIRPMRPTIVIVDDHETFRRSARGLLELDGYRVIGEAGDGAGAIEMVTSLRPDVVLLDIALPDTSGLDVAEWLAGGDARIVLVSSRDPIDLGTRVGTCGAVGFIPKDRLSGEALAAVLAGAA